MSSTRNRKGRRKVPVTSLTVAEVMDAPALVEEYTIRLQAPAMVVILEVDSPPRIEAVNVTTQGEAGALQDYLDTNELALDVRSAFYSRAEDDPQLHERRERYCDRLDEGATLSSLCVSD